MGAKVSAEMKHALFLVVQEGKRVKESARIAGVDASSVYKALRRIQAQVLRPAVPKHNTVSTDLSLVQAYQLPRRDAWR
jgi:transposase-like protein